MKLSGWFISLTGGEVDFDLFTRMSQAFDDFPMAKQIWVPLYFLSKTYGDLKFQYRYLEFLLEKSKSNSGVLKGIPVSRDNVKSEFEYLSAQMKEKSEHSRALSTSVIIEESGNKLYQGLIEHLQFQLKILETKNLYKIHKYKHKVWQDLNRRFYSLSMDRFDEFKFPKEAINIDKNLNDLLGLHLKYFIRKNMGSFERSYHMDTKGSLNHEVSKRKLDDWYHPVLMRSQIDLFEGLFQEKQFSFFEVATGNDQVTYDPFQKAFYADLPFFKSKPATSLRYALLKLLVSIHTRDFVLLQLDPVKMVLPLLETSKSFALASPMEQSGHVDAEILQEIDPSALLGLLDVVGPLDERLVIQHWEQLQMKGLIRMLTVSMDLIGILEWLVGKRIESILQKNYMFKTEIEKVAKLGKLVISAMQSRGNIEIAS